MTRAHARKKLWRLGSNPPLVLLAHGRFEALDQRWNCDGLGWKKPTDLEEHVSRGTAPSSGTGRGRVPWLADGLYPQLWWPHVRDARCLLGLPGVPLKMHCVSIHPRPRHRRDTATYALAFARSSRSWSGKAPPSSRGGGLAMRFSASWSASASRASSSAPRLRFFGGASAASTFSGKGGRNAGTCARRVVVAPAPRTP